MPYLRAFFFALSVAALTYVGLSNNVEALPTTAWRMVVITFGQIFAGYWLGYHVEKPIAPTKEDVERFTESLRTPGQLNTYSGMPLNRNDVYRVVAYDAVTQEQYGCISNVTYDKLNDAKQRLSNEEEIQGHPEIYIKIEIQRFGL